MDVFFNYELGEIKKQKPELPPNWPSEDQMKRLIQRAGGPFIYAATVCRFIGAENVSPTKRLNRILKGEPSQKATQELDETYSKIIKYNLTEELDKEEIPVFYENFRRVVGCVKLLFDSLSAKAISKLYDDMEVEDVYTTLKSLRSVLVIPESHERPILLFHDSFREFLLSEQRCKDVNLRIDKS
jgi:hypothetical protein